MKFGNRFKKQQPLIPQDIYVGGSDSINTERARGRISPVGWDHQNDEGPPTKKGLHVLKKLNCGSAMNKDRHEDNQYPGFNPQHTYRPTYVTPPVVQESHGREHTNQQSSPRKFNKNHRRDTPSVRPVLITVNDGDLGDQHTPNQPQQNAEFKSTFLVGAGGIMEDPRMNMNRPPRTVTPEKEERKPKSCVMTPRRLQGSDPFEGENGNRNCLVPNRKGPQNDQGKEMDEMEELQRIARKNRWKRGVERSWKDDGDFASASGFGEESTAFSSYLTNESDYDSYTEGSLGSSQWTGYTPRSAKDQRGQRRSRSLGRRRNVFDSVAEDLGVVASMLLSDGTSCISGAVDITRETIVSCKQN
mmetsp:Transcript_13756/g.33314  ORF Transcript_13756/g.33314 Transcript_13756/m.33314 type:complete len:359 (-) Transcript_13756:221-1297(-)